MAISDEMVKRVTDVLHEWNPLGAAAATVLGPEGYRIEACDILCEARIASVTKRRIETIVQAVLNQAFHLELTREECRVPTARIREIIASGGL